MAYFWLSAALPAAPRNTPGSRKGGLGRALGVTSYDRLDLKQFMHVASGAARGASR